MSNFLRVIFFLCFIPSTVFSWNAMGHMVIGNIAYQNLKPNVQQKIDTMIQDMQSEYPHVTNMDYLAQWPDTLFSQKIMTFSHWHYINSPVSFDGMQPTKDLILSDNAVWALKTMSAVVKNGNANRFERSRFLAFFIHIISDLHQPLHTVSLVSKRYPQGDRGGNLYTVRVRGDRVKLHKLWDSGCGLFHGDSRSHRVGELATEIMRNHPKGNFGNRAINYNFTDWVEEGKKVSLENVYSLKEGQTATTNYISDCQRLSSEEAALAGYRIANLLNDIIR